MKADHLNTQSKQWIELLQSLKQYKARALENYRYKSTKW